MIAENQILWEDCNILSNIMVNVVILLSYSGWPDKDDALEHPKFLHYDSKTTLSIIKYIGIINIVFSSLIVFNFMLKRAPLIYKSAWDGFLKIKPKCCGLNIVL